MIARIQSIAGYINTVHPSKGNVKSRTTSRAETNMATITFTDDSDDAGQRMQRYYLEFPTEFVFYAIAAIFLMIFVLMVKLMWDGERDNGGERRPTESSGLLSSKEEALFSSYGTTEEDVESGTVGSCSSSSEDLYDGKICVICYDDQRNCFFIPCGHCISCNSCAMRITSEANKSCPICRTIIKKVRMLHIL